ncbi:MAG: hybrid sensor histidine kinase/response regulator [Micavibrio sp.]|nr:hybrid sensor histidine kinase/response regulator [Micavibrio sp.]
MNKEILFSNVNRAGRGSAVDDPLPERVNILIVDDLPEKLVVYKTILDDLDQNLIMAGSGEEALKFVLKNEFAVILLDVNMPGIDGFEVASLIRERKKSARTPIIFLTAFTDDVQVAQGYASGAVDYLPTPVVPQILKAKVQVFIELFQMRQQSAMQAEERARRTAAEDADRRKDEFLGMLAHELRNPLGPIRNAVHLLQVVKQDDPRRIELKDMIERQVTHMTRLIDDLLDSTRLSRGQILLRRERCDLTQIVSQTTRDYRPAFDASGLKIETDIPAHPVWVDGDPTRLVQSIGNLLHNAHKFTDPGGMVRIGLSFDKDQRIAKIVIEDSGVGIDAATIPHIFEIFRQGDQGLDRYRGGLGLGLSLVKGLIELHRGKISARSPGPGQGAVFTIELPARILSDAVKVEDENIVIPDDKKGRVLVIEDNVDTADSISWLLEIEGYEVETAHSGVEGLEKAKSFLPRVVLCDIGLPGLDGYQVARQIRNDPKLSATYVIALTGYGRDEDQRQAREAGFDLHLTKPVDHANLKRALAHLSA